MELRVKRLVLLPQPVGPFLTGDDRDARDVVDRLLRIELGALAAGPVQNVDQMALQVEKPQFENGEQPDGACAYDYHIRVETAGSSVIRGICVHSTLYSCYKDERC